MKLAVTLCKTKKDDLFKKIEISLIICLFSFAATAQFSGRDVSKIEPNKITSSEWSGIPTVFCACAATHDVAILDDNLNPGGTFIAGYPGLEDWSMPAGLGIYKGNVAVIDVVMQGLFTYNPRVSPPAVIGAGDNLGSQPNQIIVDMNYGYVIISGTNEVKVLNLAAQSTSFGNQRMITTIPARIGSGTESTNPTCGVMHNDKLYVTLTGLTDMPGGNQLLEIAVRDINTSIPPTTPQILATRALSFLANELQTDPGAPPNYPSPAGVAEGNGKLYVALSNLGNVSGIPQPVGPGYLAEIDPVTWTKTLHIMPPQCRNPRHVLAANNRIYVSCSGLFGQGEPTEGVVVIDAATMEVIRVATLHCCGPECSTSGPNACFTAAPGKMVIVGDRLVIADEMSGRIYVTDLEGIIPEGMEMGIKVCELECYSPTHCVQSILDIVVIEGRPIITTTNLPIGKIGIEYNQTIAANGITPITWSLQGGNLPNGLSFNATDGIIFGTPTTEGTFNFIIKATNSESSAIKGFSIEIIPAPAPPEITTNILSNGMVDEEYSQTLTADGDTPITWSIVDGALPNGLELFPDGDISGVPTAAGTFNFTVMAINNAGEDTKNLSIIIIPAPAPPEITTDILSNGMVGEEYSQTLTADGDTPIIWSIADGALPNGLELLPDGDISGVPTAAGTFNFTVMAINNAGEDTKDLSIIIDDLSSDELRITNYELQIYPNPTNGELNVTNYETTFGASQLQEENIEIFDITGRKQKIIFNFQFSIFNSIDISHLSAGIYFLHIDGKIIKVIKN